MHAKDTRRGFIRWCASAAAGVAANPSVLAAPGRTSRVYESVLLVDASGQPLTTAALKPRTTYVFHYPLVSTPCFLLKLADPVPPVSGLKTRDEESYESPGGVGPESDIVAFAAICAHKMTHPAKAVSFINFRPEKIRFRDADDQVKEAGGLIYCCSEGSVYDPAAGAKVLSGPATQPLTTIRLSFDSTHDQLSATGTIGGELYNEFIEKFGFRLGLERGLADVTAKVQRQTVVIPIDAYSRSLRQC